MKRNDKQAQRLMQLRPTDWKAHYGNYAKYEPEGRRWRVVSRESRRRMVRKAILQSVAEKLGRKGDALLKAEAQLDNLRDDLKKGTS